MTLDIARFLDNLLAPDPDAPQTYPAGRVCAQDGCGTRLSIYNGGEWCARHEPESDVLHYCGCDFRVCRCGEVFEVHTKASATLLCPACKRAAVKPPTRSLRRDGSRDAIQRVQRRITRKGAL